MGVIFSWWLAFEVLGVVALPLSAALFAQLPDRGWALAKPLGLLVLGWLIWFPLSLVTALPYSRGWIAATFVLFAAGNFVLLRRRPDVAAALRQMLTSQRGYIALCEALFLGTFVLMAWVRSFTPAVADTEKFMDQAFLSAIWRAPHLPPPDPWLSGQPINYYYFGHFLVATVAKLLGTTPAIAFNVAVALIFALAAVAVFGVATSLAAARLPVGRPLLGAGAAGLASVLLVLVLGNVRAAQAGWQYAGEQLQLTPALGSRWAWWLHPNLWGTLYWWTHWWTPSRAVPNTITEFPAFSFTLADLHAHVLALPFAALAVGVALNLFRAPGVGRLGAFGEGRSAWLPLGASALVVGGLYAINGWDLPTYLALTLAALAAQHWLAHGQRLSSAALLDFGRTAAIFVAICILAYLPFYRGFSSPSQGVGLVPPGIRSPIGDEFAMFGIAAFILLSFVALGLARWVGARVGGMGGLSGAGLAVLLAPLGLALLARLTPGYSGWTSLWCLLIVWASGALLLRGLGAWRWLAAAPVESQPWQAPDSALWVYLLLTFAAGLVLVCEVVFLRDIFGGSANGQLGQDFRMNTVFKLYYQAWLLAGIAGGPALVWLLGGARRALAEALAELSAPLHARESTAASGALALAGVAWRARPTAPHPLPMNAGEGTGATWKLAASEAESPPRTAGQGGDLLASPVADEQPEWHGRLRGVGAGGIVIWSVVLVVLLGAGLVYPLLGTASRTENFSLTRSLDGTQFMATDAVDHGDAPALAWLNAHIQGDPVIVEAASYDEYTHLGRVSTFTGMPTLLGWGGHEVQWRYNWLAQPEHSLVLGQRLDAVTQIYTNPDAAAVKTLLRRYAVGYLYVGEAERQQYAKADLTRFAAFLPVVYQDAHVTIYRAP